MARNQFHPHPRRILTQVLAYVSVTAVLFALLYGAQHAPAQQPSSSKVAELKKILGEHFDKNDPEFLMKRKENLEKKIEELRTLAEMGEAFALIDWDLSDEQVKEIDRAARTKLGERIIAHPTVAAIRKALSSKEKNPSITRERRAAAETLKRFYLGEDEKRRTTVPRIVVYAFAVVPLAGLALQNDDIELQRIGAAILLQVAKDCTEDSSIMDKLIHDKDQKNLLDAFKKQTSLLAERAQAADPSVQIPAVQTLELLSLLHHALEPQPGSGQSPVFGDLQTARKALDKCLGVRGENADVRISAAQGIENLGAEGIESVPALVLALDKDKDLFVRWVAVRALGKLHKELKKADPKRLKEAVGRIIARLLDDEDLDVRIAAATALWAYGADAPAAVEPLARVAAEADPSLRLAAMYALGEIGKPADATKVNAKLVKALGFQQDKRVRMEAARLLGRFGGGNQKSIDALRKALKEDSEPEVRSAASEALLSISPR